MRAIEALERLLAAADRDVNTRLMQCNVGDKVPEEINQDMVAQSICQAMVNTAIPIARWRLHVQIDEVPEKASKFKLTDYTVCGTTILGVKTSLIGLWSNNARVDVSLWEQQVNGAEMIAGYRGWTKDQKFRRFYSQLDNFQVEPTIQ